MKITRRKAMMTLSTALMAVPVFGANAVNPIVSFDEDKLVEFGKKTLERKPTALDRVSVRRLCMYIEKTIRNSYRMVNYYKPCGHYNFVGIASDLMDDIEKRGGIQDFQVCSWSSSEVDEQNGKICIKPMRTDKWIDIIFTFRRHSMSSVPGESYEGDASFWADYYYQQPQGGEGFPVDDDLSMQQY